MKENHKHGGASHKEGLHHKNDDRKIFLSILLIALVLTIIFVFWPHHTASQSLSARAEFAACLTDKGITMYGTDTCPNCQLQKSMFEEDFSRIHYINCDIKQDECTQKNIQGYPTWMYNGQSRLGIQTFQNLALMSGCQAP